MYSICDTKPITENENELFETTFVLPKSLAGSGTTSTIVLDDLVLSNYNSICPPISSFAITETTPINPGLS